MNKVTLQGNLARDLDYKELGGDKALARGLLAVSRYAGSRWEERLRRGGGPAPTSFRRYLAGWGGFAHGPGAVADGGDQEPDEEGEGGDRQEQAAQRGDRGLRRRT
jgi:hypothetical protein